MKQALADALEARGYTSLTDVQAAVSAPELIGRDLLVSAQTGSGKTVAFGMAIAPSLLGEDEAFGTAEAPLALVIAPTRELALQVKRELSWLYEKAGAVVASTVGGMDMRDERRALARGAHIVVATPGRLRDHIMRESIDLGALKAVVLDEADEMLDLGFREDLEFILEQSPEDRQTLLFSATVSAPIAKLAQSYQRDAERIATTSGTTQHADIEYRALKVSARDSENAIINLLRFYEAPNAIIFCNTRATVNRLTTRLSNRGFSVVALSGELSQSERSHALQAMRDGRARVCVATDVAARGIDLPKLELVIHADLPTNTETLLHRSGRTGRAGRKGVSALIVPPAATKKASRLLGWAKLTADWGPAPSADEVIARDEERLLSDTDWTAPVEESSEGTVAKLVENFTAEQIAAAFLRLHRERHSAPEDLSDPSEPAKERAPFGPSTWFSLEGGRAAGAEPRRVLPMLCKMGDISREDIGAIRIQQDASLIEIRDSAVAGFLAAVGPEMRLEEGALLTQLAEAPVFERGPRGDKPAGPRGPKGPREPREPRDFKDRKPRHERGDRDDRSYDKRKGKPYEGKPRAKPERDPEVHRPAKADGERKPRATGPKPAKPAGKPSKPAKPEGNWADPSFKPRGKPGAKGRDGDDRKPRGKGFGDKGGFGKGPSKDGFKGKPKGPKPPVGKPNSKKNIARRAAAEGGFATPRKPRSKG